MGFFDLFRVDVDEGDTGSRWFSDSGKALDFAFRRDGQGHDVDMFGFRAGAEGVSGQKLDWWNNGNGWDKDGW